MKLTLLSLVSIFAILSLVGCSGGDSSGDNSPAPAFGSKAGSPGSAGTPGGAPGPGGAPAGAPGAKSMKIGGN